MREGENDEGKDSRAPGLGEQRVKHRHVARGIWPVRELRAQARVREVCLLSEASKRVREATKGNRE